MNSHRVVRVPGCAFVVALLACIALQGCSGGADAQQSAAPPTNPPDTTAPTVPENVVATAMSTTRIDIRWDTSTDANGVTGYRLYRNGSADALATVNAPTTSYSDTNLTANTAYSYFVRSFDSAGNQSAASVQVSATTQTEPAPADVTAPSVPTDLVAAATSTTRIDVSWSASTDTGGSGLAGYRIYRNGSAAVLATVGAPATTYADINLTASTQYSYIIKSFDAAGNESTASSSASATTQAEPPPPPDTTAPTVPANVVATAVSSARINVSWSASTDAGGSGLAGYRLYRNGAASAVATVNAPATTYADTALAASTQYSYVVKAFDAAGNESAASNTSIATTQANPPADVTPPTVPTGLAAIAPSNTRISLTWSASTDTGGSGLSGYHIYRNGSATTVATVTASATTYSDMNLTANTQYSYVIKAFDGAGNESAASSAASATTQANPDTTAPSVPGNLIATTVSSTQINLSWSASTDTGGSDLAGYRVYRNGAATAVATLNSATTTYADTGLTATTQYSYVVRAFDGAANQSAASNAATATTQATPDTTAPSVPTNVIATAVSSTRINLSWSASMDTGGSSLSGYRIYRNGSATALTTVNAPATAYADINLTGSTQYSYVIKAFDGAGNESAGSSAASATTQASPDTIAPSVPTNVVATAASNTRINLSWSASTDTGGSGLSGYHIYRNGVATALATVNSPTTTYADTGLAGSTQYSYVVKAFDVAGNESGASTTATATTQANPDTTAPGVPANVNATAASSTRIDVSWSASTDTGGSGLSGYRLYRDGAGTVLATVNAPATTYADTGLAASTQYSYVVRAFDVAGNQSAASPAAIATTQANPGGVSGLDSRPSNTTCLAWDAPATDGDISLEDFTSLGFNSAVAMLQAPADNAHWYVVQQDGKVRRFATANPAGIADFIDISGRVQSPIDGSDRDEMGLLGMAFHPNFPTDRRVFLSYTTIVSGQRISRISSFTVNPGDATADDTSEKILLAFNQPESNHKGGNIVFGPDGYLYIGFGDGGGGGDAHGDPGNGQRLTTLLGKMLRIDVTAATGYDIPSTNPFAGQAKCGPDARASGNCPEIFAWGFRNPWRWSFDRSTGELWVGDVGQELWEEVDQVAIGGNYGWRCREGANDYASATTSGCGSAPLIDPVAQYQHPQGFAITGGYVYRGTQSTPLKGRFLFGDSGTGRVWAWVPENATAQDPRKPTQLLDASAASIVSFGQGNDGELYVVTPSQLKHIVFAPASSGGTVAATLSATGCVNPSDPTQPASGLIPYAVNAPFWSDGAVKERYIGLPDNSTISVNASTTDWDFPLRTVLMKNFRVNNQLIETRLFMHHPDGSWGGFSYAWNAQQTDATFVKGGAVRDIGGGQEWIFPSESQCVECHTAAAGRSLGLETRQLNRDLLYTQTNRTANELFTLNHIGVLSPAIPDPAVQPTMPDPVDTNATLAARARAYLHTNCSQCHRPGGPTPSSMDLRYSTSFAQTMTCNVDPGSGDLGVANAKLIAPGSAANSILVNRMNRRDANGMPKLGSKQVDATGVALITQWINSLSGC